MANSDDTGQSRVNRMEKNNRRTENARGSMAKTPRQRGAQAGFKSNPTKGTRIARRATG